MAILCGIVLRSDLVQLVLDNSHANNAKEKNPQESRASGHAFIGHQLNTLAELPQPNVVYDRDD